MKSPLRLTPCVFEVQPPRRIIDRHLHSEPYASLVLDGGYLEAGDMGRRRVQTGDLLVHDAFESHANEFQSGGARMFNLALGPRVRLGLRPGRVRDVDAVVRLAERDPLEAWRLVEENLEPTARWESDWPDDLALALRADPAMSLRPWAESRGLTPSEVSRGFRSAYRTSPKQFRAVARTRGAFKALASGRATADVVSDLGFSDQAHLCRAVRALTGMTPRTVMQLGSIQA